MTPDEATQLILWAVNERLDMDIEDFGVGVRAKILSIINQIADTAGNDRLIEVSEMWRKKAEGISICHNHRNSPRGPMPDDYMILLRAAELLRKIAEAAPAKPPHALTHAP